jgi:hypothetical protein
MKSKTQTTRRFMVPFKTGSKEEAFNLLMLHANNYQDALKIARCIAGPNAEKFLCYKDFLVYD